MKVLIVFLGGGLGSVVRYAIALAINKLGYPSVWATLLANVTACLLIGMITASVLKGNLSEQQRLLFATGFCGGFSTFSTFSNETWSLFNSGQLLMVFVNIALSVVLCLAATFVGLKWGIL